MSPPIPPDLWWPPWAPTAGLARRRRPDEAERLLALAPEVYNSRREFLQRTAETAGLAASLGLVLDPDTVVAEAARRRASRLPSPRNLPIDTFVALMMENRSFDHYLGWLPGADGRQAGLRFTDPQGRSHPTYRLAGNFQGCGYPDPDHSWGGGRTELDGGRLDGFLRAQSDCSRSATTRSPTYRPSPTWPRPIPPSTGSSARCWPPPIPTGSTCTPASPTARWTTRYRAALASRTPRSSPR